MRNILERFQAWRRYRVAKRLAQRGYLIVRSDLWRACQTNVTDLHAYLLRSGALTNSRHLRRKYATRSNRIRQAAADMYFMSQYRA